MSEEHRVRKHKFQVYLTEEEWLILKHKSKYVGHNASDYIRKIILQDNIIRLPVEGIMETSRVINDYKMQLNHIGININQLMKVIHENNDLYSQEEISEAIRLIETVGETFNELTNVMYKRLYGIED